MYNRPFSRHNAKSSENHPRQLTRVEERLYLGALRDAESLASSNPHEIRSVITLCQEPVRRRRADIEYLQFPIDENEAFDPQLLATILAAMECSVARGPVCVHCQLGMSRSPAILAAYLHRTGFSTYEAALEHLEELRPCVDPGAALIRSVKSALDTLGFGSPTTPKRSSTVPKRGGR